VRTGPQPEPAGPPERGRPCLLGLGWCLCINARLHRDRDPRYAEPKCPTCGAACEDVWHVVCGCPTTDGVRKATNPVRDIIGKAMSSPALPCSVMELHALHAAPDPDHQPGQLAACLGMVGTRVRSELFRFGLADKLLSSVLKKYVYACIDLSYKTWLARCDAVYR